jgi:hypothetical protein
MHSLPSQSSRIRGFNCTPKGSRARGSRLGIASLLAASAIACGDDEGGTVALADSASLTALTNNTLRIPTTVAVREGVAWVVESQFDQYAPFGGAGMPGDFRILGIPLNGGALQTIALPPNTFPEGIAVSKGGNLFVGSVARGDIYNVPADETEARLFLPTGVLQNSAIGLTVSTDSQTLWVCDTNPTPAMGELATGAVVGIGITDGEVKARHELEPSATGAFCNDLVMSPDGALWITESFGGRIFRITDDELFDDNSAEVWLQDPELAGVAEAPFGANGIALLGGRLFVVNSAFGTLMSIDASLDAPDSNDITLIALTEDDDEVALANPDGITVLNDRELLIVENGLGLGDEGKRLVRVDVAR